MKRVTGIGEIFFKEKAFGFAFRGTNDRGSRRRRIRLPVLVWNMSVGWHSGSVLRNWVTKHWGQPLSMTQLEFARFVESKSESAAQIFKAAGTEWPR